MSYPEGFPNALKNFIETAVPTMEPETVETLILAWSVGVDSTQIWLQLATWGVTFGGEYNQAGFRQKMQVWIDKAKNDEDTNVNFGGPFLTLPKPLTEAQQKAATERGAKLLFDSFKSKLEILGLWTAQIKQLFTDYLFNRKPDPESKIMSFSYWLYSNENYKNREKVAKYLQDNFTYELFEANATVTEQTETAEAQQETSQKAIALAIAIAGLLFLS